MSFCQREVLIHGPQLVKTSIPFTWGFCFVACLILVEWLPFIVKNLAEIFFVVADTWRYLTTDGQVLEVLYYAVLRQCVMLCDVMIQCVLL